MNSSGLRVSGWHVHSSYHSDKERRGQPTQENAGQSLRGSEYAPGLRQEQVPVNDRRDDGDYTRGMRVSGVSATGPLGRPHRRSSVPRS
jgi:hypothetical protein